jgi:type VI secretion system secreted protein Hcp
MASDYLLEIEGIKGESKDDKLKDTIEVDSFSWGATQSGTFGGGGGGGAGKVSFQDIHFTNSVNKSSPKLMEACATGQHIKKATLHVRKAGGKQEEMYTVTLEDCLVSSYQSGGSSHGGGVVPTDQFSLNFAKIKYEYKEQKADGSVGGTVAAGYDLKAAKKT